VNPRVLVPICALAAIASLPLRFRVDAELAMHDRDVTIRNGAALMVGSERPPRSAPPDGLVELLGDSRNGRTAAWALGTLGAGAKTAIPRLLDALTGADELTRATIVGALVRIAPADPRVVAALDAARRDASPLVRKFARAPGR
jgi:HEAT repeat protein